eukprot:m.213767 g.213767  ORF g.213767 m.213767 type:complete len:152 (-) comp10763_c0_seq3:1687-2142(-)
MPSGRARTRTGGAILHLLFVVRHPPQPILRTLEIALAHMIVLVLEQLVECLDSLAVKAGKYSARACKTRDRGQSRQALTHAASPEAPYALDRVAVLEVANMDCVLGISVRYGWKLVQSWKTQLNRASAAWSHTVEEDDVMRIAGQVLKPNS